MLESLALGFSTALTVANLGYAAAGVLFGTLVGVLPGLGPVATIAMLLPFTYTLEPASAVIMLAGIYYGAQYGGSTTAILLNLPGEASAVVTVSTDTDSRGRAAPRRLCPPPQPRVFSEARSPPPHSPSLRRFWPKPPFCSAPPTTAPS